MMQPKCRCLDGDVSAFCTAHQNPVAAFLAAHFLNWAGPVLWAACQAMRRLQDEQESIIPQEEPWQVRAASDSFQ